MTLQDWIEGEMQDAEELFRAGGLSADTHTTITLNGKTYLINLMVDNDGYFRASGRPLREKSK